MTLSRLRTVLAAACLGMTSLAQASTTCQPTVSGTLCVSQVDFHRFAQAAYQSQAQSQWCWAASISMVFSFHGYDVAQERIVAEAYGSVVNMPAVAGVVMAQALNRSWTDDGQRQFHAQLSGVYDPAVGVSNLDNQRLIAELDHGRPFIMGTAGHAVVVTAMQYFPTPFGPHVVAIGVFDPWPGRGARGLSAQEMTPVERGGALSFVALADVQAGAGSAAKSPFATAGGSADAAFIAAGALAVALLIASGAGSCSTPRRTALTRPRHRGDGDRPAP